MPNASAISIDDGQATPVSHTFTPSVVTPSSSTFVDRDSATSAGSKRIHLGFSPQSAKRETDRLSVRIDVPYEQTVDGVTSVAYTARFSGDIVLPSQMTQAQRDDMAAFIQNAFGHSVIVGMVTDLDPVY
jgi:hypothetical protein